MPESVVKEKMHLKEDFDVKAYKEKYGTNVSDWHRPNDVNQGVFTNDPNCIPDDGGLAFLLSKQGLGKYSEVFLRYELILSFSFKMNKVSLLQA